MKRSVQIIEDESLRNRGHVFADRLAAGDKLAELLDEHVAAETLVLAIPAGGVPVAVALARRLDLKIDLAVASKIPRPGNAEAGYGAVAFDGTVLLDQQFIDRSGLDRAAVDRDIDATREKVEERLLWMRGNRHMPAIAHRPVVLVDDGLASGATMMAAIKAVRGFEPVDITVAVPTANAAALQLVGEACDRVVCANVRDASPFAVADAYVHWHDVSDAEALGVLHDYVHHRS